MADQYQREFDGCRRLIEDRLNSLFADMPGVLAQAMRYSLLAGGKRIRPVLLLAFCKACGGDVRGAVRPACGVELLHTYSLIHDDLPCMDNDALRRGVPTNHTVYGECTATLAGDAMQAAAFEEVLLSDYPADTLVRMCRFLAQAAGPRGICGGQLLDMSAEGRALPPEEIERIHRLKTASLLVAACRMGVAAAGGKQYDAAGEYAEAVGLAFQLRDDVLNVTGTPEVMGKPSGSDAGSGKSTFVSLYGVRECERMIARETQRAVAAAGENFDEPGFLIWLARNLAERKC